MFYGCVRKDNWNEKGDNFIVSYVECMWFDIIYQQKLDIWEQGMKLYLGYITQML